MEDQQKIIEQIEQSKLKDSIDSMLLNKDKLSFDCPIYLETSQQIKELNSASSKARKQEHSEENYISTQQDLQIKNQESEEKHLDHGLHQLLPSRQEEDVTEDESFMADEEFHSQQDSTDLDASARPIRPYLKDPFQSASDHYLPQEQALEDENYHSCEESPSRSKRTDLQLNNAVPFSQPTQHANMMLSRNSESIRELRLADNLHEIIVEVSDDFEYS
jgi:hypothetical protein